MTKQLLKFGTAIMITLLALVVLWQLRLVVVYVAISLALAAALRPAANRLVGKSLIVRIAWILLYLVVLGCFGALLFMTAEAAINEVQQLALTLSVQDEWRPPVWLEDSSFQQTFLSRLPPPSALFNAFTGDQGQLLLPGLLGFSQGIGTFVSGLLIILFLSIYWSINQIHFERLWLSLLPSGQRKQTRDIWQTVEPDVGAYIRGQVIHSLLAGLLLGLGYWLLGSPYPALLALIGALASLIPLIGVAIAVIPVLLVGLLTSVPLGIVTALYALIVLIALGAWVKPRLFNRQWDNPILTVVLLIALAEVFGLVGIIIAPPLSAVIQILWSRLISRRVFSGAADQISDLKKRQERVRETIEAMEEPPLALVTSSMERLAQLIEKAEPVLQAGLPSTGLPSAPLPAGPDQSSHAVIAADGEPQVSIKA